MWVPDKDTPREKKRRSYIGLCTLGVVVLSMIRSIIMPYLGVETYLLPNILWGGIVVYVVYKALNILLAETAVTDKDYREFIVVTVIFAINLLLAASGAYA
jgi:hypothetical protein